ncbi:MAG: hypothetical protein RQ731_07960 [Anaerosomatales bacterium]|nr:hypothetical protein [Anaerosomatales bacterium]
MPASGAMEGAKGDVCTELDFLSAFGQLMVECKHHKPRTQGKSISIEKAWLDKLREEAEGESRVPVFAFRLKTGTSGMNFKGDQHGNGANTRWMCLPLGEFVRLLEYTRDLYDRVAELESTPPELPETSGYGDACRSCRRELDGATRDVERALRRVRGALGG